ncbi:Cupredoxin [Cokeromyces recurvatus]|uniref:Cupredoxin n=1 Tax=Cokeromyces recurvatus TaxID=90255 RepID=UPI002220E624|nr:Cupredoxin [Cokeromyces recurvatus]KAI7903335.1 Cupredoxin [Cokeromyces recurvatus]
MYLLASFLVCFILLKPILTAPLNRTIRHYYIAAEKELWDYTPMQWDNFRDQPLTNPPSSLYTVYRKDKRIGSVYQKAFYRQYRDDAFRTPIAHDPILGQLGPIIRAEAGDQVRITFYNKADHPHSLHPYTTNTTKVLPGQFVQPGESYRYIWDIPSDYEFPENQSSVIWAYGSKSSPGDIPAGLLGLVVIYQPGTLQYNSPGAMFQHPKGIDQEVFTIMTNTDEAFSTYFNESGARLGFSADRLVELQQTDPLFNESNRMYHINGYVYNNNPPFNVIYGSRVRWYIVSFGVSDDDVHTAHWHGATVLHYGHRVDVVDLTPISFEVVDMVPDNVGQWLFHCHVASHFESGMSAFYQVEEIIITGDEGWGK